LLASCATVPFSGAPSLTVFAENSNINKQQYRPISEPVSESFCMGIGPLFLIWVGKQPNHEALLSHVLQKYDADVLLSANMRTSVFFFPYIFMRQCAHIEGVPAKKISRGR
jgi:hypothetical protein